MIKESGQQELFIMDSQNVFWAARLIIWAAKFINGQQDKFLE
jgi:hypothetical protein